MFGGGRISKMGAWLEKVAGAPVTGQGHVSTNTCHCEFGAHSRAGLHLVSTSSASGLELQKIISREQLVPDNETRDIWLPT
jgi:hypothetical protein